MPTGKSLVHTDAARDIGVQGLCLFRVVNGKSDEKMHSGAGAGVRLTVYGVASHSGRPADLSPMFLNCDPMMWL
jgi:hypothetical protein